MLGVTSVSGSTLSVQLSDNANEFVIADAVLLTPFDPGQDQLRLVNNGAPTINFDNTTGGFDWTAGQDSLGDFTFNTVHARIYVRRAEWFETMIAHHFVMWWVPIGHRPTPLEALERLNDLRANGPSDRAFGWESLPNVQLWKKQRCA